MRARRSMGRVPARHDQRQRQERWRKICRKPSRFRRPLADDDPDLLAGKPLHGRIPWPTAMPDLKPRMMAYYDKVNALGYEMLKLFELALDLPADALKPYFDKDMNSLRLLHYPPQQPDADGVHLGARAHTDTNAFTILAQDNNGGLEIRNRDTEWVAVPPIDGTFVVNVGEVLKVWTDAIFSSTLHRVINRSGRRALFDPVLHVSELRRADPAADEKPRSRECRAGKLHTSMPRDQPFVYGEFKAREHRAHHARPKREQDREGDDVKGPR